MRRFIGRSLIINQEPNTLFPNLLNLDCYIQKSKTTHTSGINDHQCYGNIYKVDDGERFLNHLRKNTTPGWRTRQGNERWVGGTSVISHGSMEGFI